MKLDRKKISENLSKRNKMKKKKTTKKGHTVGTGPKT